MTARKPRKGEIAARRNEEDRVVDFLGAVVPLRAREIPPLSDAADLSNVVPITSRRRIGPERRIPELQIDSEERPAPLTRRLDGRTRLMLLVAGSFAIHASLFAAFNREPPPLASVGEVSISVELELGTDRAAGRSNKPSESEVFSAQSPEPDEPVADRAEIPRPTDEKQAAEERAPEPKPAVTAALSPDPAAELPAPAKEKLDTTPPKQVAPKPVERQSEPAKKPVQRNDEGKSERKRAAPASTASVDSNSIGRGHSDADTNYRGIVSAHLARYKEFPADARSRGEQGTASVSFTLDGSGRVTSVRLARGSGVASIDQETQAMVRRASPFPAPPGGRVVSFTVPVNFYLR